MVSWTQIESAREALLKMARGKQLALPIAVEVVPKKKNSPSRRAREKRRYEQLKLF
ncbi:hypothetical protein [Leptolyngbya boryana]|uniref:hypothetical protein n=1 Tax=Leptolyngbya boryana TaxID=1184 RepID=UPI00036DE79C|nr:hypothetical protein [Leptolyngbya boryana]